MVANQIDGRADVEEPEKESLVVSDGVECELAESKKDGGVEGGETVRVEPSSVELKSELSVTQSFKRASELFTVASVSEFSFGESSEGGETVRVEPLSGQFSIGTGPPLLSKSLRVPQTLPFPSKVVGDRSDGKGPREEKRAGGVRSESNNGVSRPLGGGDGDRLVRGGRKGCEDGVSRENITHIMTNRTRGQFTSSADSALERPGICKIDDTRPRSLTIRSAKKSGTGRFRNSRGEKYNKVSYIPSSRHSNRMHLEDSRRSPHHNTSTVVSLHTPQIYIHNVGEAGINQVTSVRRGVGSPAIPQGGTDINRGRKEMSEKNR